MVNISSGAAVKAFYGWSLYCAAKAGVEAFTACVALEQQQAKHPVMVYAIRPGVIDTEMQQQIRAQDKTRFAEIEKFKALKRDGTKTLSSGGVTISVPDFDEGEKFASQPKFSPLTEHKVVAFKVTISASATAKPGVMEMHLIDATCAGRCKTDFRVLVVED